MLMILPVNWRVVSVTIMSQCLTVMVTLMSSTMTLPQLMKAMSKYPMSQGINLETV